MRWGSKFSVLVFYLILLFMIHSPSLAQLGFDTTSYRPPDSPLTIGGNFRGSEFLSNSSVIPLDPFTLSSDIQTGYAYYCSDNRRIGRLTSDYIVPINLYSVTLFSEIHFELQDFNKISQKETDERMDLSLGGGCRRLFWGDTVIGINGFYDTTCCAGAWHHSGGFGLEMVTVIGTRDVIDLNLNYYADFFEDSLASERFGKSTPTCDLELGYSHELWRGGYDLRLLTTAYAYNNGSGVYGHSVGAELKCPLGLGTFRFETGHDRLNHTYHSVALFTNLGLELENLLTGQNQFVMPEPLFRGIRNKKKLLSERVKRHWYRITH